MKKWLAALVLLCFVFVSPARAASNHYIDGYVDGYSYTYGDPGDAGRTSPVPGDSDYKSGYSAGYTDVDSGNPPAYTSRADNYDPTAAPSLGGGHDSYALAVTPFSGVVTSTGGFVASMISRFGVPAILVAVAVAGWLFVKRIAKSAFH